MSYYPHYSEFNNSATTRLNSDLPVYIISANLYIYIYTNNVQFTQTLSEFRSYFIRKTIVLEPDNVIRSNGYDLHTYPVIA